MFTFFKNIPKRKYLLIILLVMIVQKSYGNLNAIDFTKINFPKENQGDINFVKDNVQIFNHWAPNWTSSLSKKNVIKKLNTVFEITNKLKDHNIEVELFLGELANYLYNLEVEEYYQKAVDHFLIAKTLAPTDYRVYWFLGNHYALSATQILSIESYQTALKYMPVNESNSYFWNEYSFACTLARMPGTARYAAHQTSVIAGKTTQTEDDVNILTKKLMKIPPTDTSMEAKDVWSVIGRTRNKLILLNKIIGIRLAVDSLWSLNLAGFTKQLDYISIKPKEVIAKNGKKIGYSMLLFAKIPEPAESLSAFYEKLTIKTKYKKPINFYADKFKNAITFELQDPTIYPDWGGGHSYALALERDYPDFPGKALEIPMESPKNNNSQVNYYAANTNFSRVKAKLYYYILLDSCEDINEESLAVFKEFLDNLVIE